MKGCGPGVRFPPPFVFAAGFLAGLALERWIWRFHLTPPNLRPIFLIAGWTAILAGLGLAGWGMFTFLRSRTAIIPTRSARTLVLSGPYRYTRNPMYLGVTSTYGGLASVFDVGWPIVLLPVVLLALYTLVIRREERYLTAAFPEEYPAYCARVRRWL